MYFGVWLYNGLLVVWGDSSASELIFNFDNAFDSLVRIPCVPFCVPVFQRKKLVNGYYNNARVHLQFLTFLYPDNPVLWRKYADQRNHWFSQHHWNHFNCHLCRKIGGKTGQIQNTQQSINTHAKRQSRE